MSGGGICSLAIHRALGISEVKVWLEINCTHQVRQPFFVSYNVTARSIISEYFFVTSPVGQCKFSCGAVYVQSPESMAGKSERKNISIPLSIFIDFDTLGKTPLIPGQTSFTLGESPLGESVSGQNDQLSEIIVHKPFLVNKH